MANDELKKKIIDMLQSAKRCIGQDCNTCKYKKESANYIGVSCMTLRIADALIEAGYGDVKEIKYRVRRAEKALYIACYETAEIIFKDDFDRHAQEYMYGYLKQAEKELAEEKNE